MLKVVVIVFSVYKQYIFEIATTTTSEFHFIFQPRTEHAVNKSKK